ncbi:MAG: T9SS type A sorting domain-containing protein [Chitinophagales bacterium]
MIKRFICLSLILAAFLCLLPSSTITAACTSATVTITPEGPFCPGSGPITITVSGAGSTTGVFTGDGVVDASPTDQVATFDPYVAGPGSHTISFIALGSLGGGCQIGNTINQTFVVSDGTAPSIDGADGCSSQDITLVAAGDAGAMYAWSDASMSTTSSITIAPADANEGDIYTVTVTSASGCVGTATVAISINTTPTATAMTTAVCVGGDVALATTVSGGTAGTTYAWSSPATGTTSVATVAAADAVDGDVYTVTVTNETGCSSTDEVIITVNALPSIQTVNITGPICDGDDPSNTVTVGFFTSADPGSPYTWSGGLVASSTTSTAGPGPFGGSVSATPNPLFGAVDGEIYTVTVTDVVTGCINTATVEATINPVPTASASSEEACSSDDVTLTAMVMGGDETTYTWSGSIGSTGTMATATIPAGTASDGDVFTVTVTNATGCIGTATVAVTINTSPTATALTTAACVGGDVALATTVSGGTAGSTYAWSSPATGTTSVATVASADAVDGDVYTVTVTNETGCSTTSTVAITVNELPTITANVTGPICDGDDNNTLVFDFTTNAVDGSAYTWGEGSVSSGSVSGGTAAAGNPIAEAVDANVYTVTVTDAVTGCVNTGTVAATINPLPTATATTEEACAGNDITLTATVDGGDDATYTWSSPATGTTSEATIAAADAVDGDVYTVTVTNATTCSTTATVAVTINASPMPTATVEPTATCEGGPTAALAVVTENILTDTFVWSNGHSGVGLDGFLTNADQGAGVYTVTATNATGCSATATVEVIINPLPTAIAMSTAACVGEDVSLSVSGMDVSNATYAWSSPATGMTSVATVASADAVDGDVYTVTITNDTGCSSTAEVTITVNSLPTATAATTAVCAGEDVSLEATVDGGSNPTYAWSSPATGTTSVATVAGADAVDGDVYTVTVTNDTGCSTTAEVTITVNPLPSATAVTTAVCAGVDATLTANVVSVSGGSAGTSYAWSSPATGTTSVATVASADAVDGDVYTVTVTNDTGCSTTATVALTIYPLPTAAAMTTAVCAGEDVSVSVMATGGTTFTYVWSDDAGSTDSAITVASADAVDGDVYTVTVTNDTGCSSTGTVAITVNPLPSATAASTAVCSGEDVTLEATVEGGSNATYAWSSPATGTTSVGTVAAADAVDGDVYTVTVTNDTGCSTTATVAITLNPSPTATAATEAVCDGADVTLTATVEGGVGETYAWSSPATGTTSEATVAGADAVDGDVYTVTVTNDTGCTTTATVALTLYPTPAPTITGTFEFCRGREAFLDAGGYPTMPNTYLWSNSETTQTIATTVVGVYTVTVTTADGCSGTATAEVSATPCLAAAGELTLNTDAICPGEPIIATTVGENQDETYSNYFFLYSEDNLGNTTFVAEQEASSSTGTFEDVEPGDYLVCAYNECTDCDPNPSPIGAGLDNIGDTGSIQDGCYDYVCASITVPEPFEPLAGTGQASEDNATGQNVYIAEACGGIMPYSIDFTSSGGFATVNTYPSATPGCINYQVVYTDEAEWTLTITDSNGCSDAAVVFSSDGNPEPLPQIVSTEVNPETCPADFDGAITVFVSGGDDSCGTYSYDAASTNGFSESGTFTAPDVDADGTSSFILADLASGTYGVTVTDCAGTTTVQDIYVGRSGIIGRRGGCRPKPGKADLDAQLLETVKVYPNPFTNETTIEFSVLEGTYVEATIYTLDSREVAKVYDGQAEGGVVYKLPFNSESLPSGVYLLQLTTDLGAVYHERLYITK